MPVAVKVTGIFLGNPLNETFEELLRKNDTPRKVFARLDKRKVLGRKFFKNSLAKGRATLLLNGDRLEIPGGLNQPLCEGDEISLLSAIAGG